MMIQRLVMSFVTLCLAATAFSADDGAYLDDAIDGDHRTPAFKERDRYRHPKQTLEFLGLQPDMTVVEIWPGRGWYTEILAPVLKENGQLYAAGFAVSARRPPEWRKQMARELNAKFAAQPEVYGNLIVTELSVPERVEIAPPASADLVLTFRNVHNWMKGEYADGVFAAMYTALKPGATLGVVEHRAAEGTPEATMIETGYVTESHVIALAEKAGFQLVDRAEINANSKDTKDHPRGVWTLPPSLRLKEVDRDKYLEIGESDRMTLKFIKPEIES